MADSPRDADTADAHSADAHSADAHSSSLTLWIVGAIVAAVVLSLAMPLFGDVDWVEVAEGETVVFDDGRTTIADAPVGVPVRQMLVEGVFGTGGEIFLNLLFMLVVPLVVTSVMSGILSLGDVRRLGRPGLYTILYYLTTTVLAVGVGILMANLFRPGQGSDLTPDVTAAAELDSRTEEAAQAGAPESAGEIVHRLLQTIFTKNLIRSAANNDLLPLILFSIAFAAILTTRLDATVTLRGVITEAADVLMGFVLLVMRIAPLGIFCLVVGKFGEAALKGEFFDQLRELAWYAATVMSGMAVHALVTLPLLHWIFRRKNPYRFIVDMGKALLTAFGTASSLATLPLSIETAVDNAGVSRKAANFVLPLGATVNMDATALYEAAAALFIAQVAGVDLSLGQQLLVAVTATLAAIGAAGVPEAGLITMLIVLKAVGLPTEYVALILPIDWLLDRFRTAINVLGDANGAAILTPLLPDETELDRVPTEPHLTDAAGPPASTVANEPADTVVLKGRPLHALADSDSQGSFEPRETVEMPDVRRLAGEPDPTEELPPQSRPS